MLVSSIPFSFCFSRDSFQEVCCDVCDKLSICLIIRRRNSSCALCATVRPQPGQSSNVKRCWWAGHDHERLLADVVGRLGRLFFLRTLVTKIVTEGRQVCRDEPPDRTETLNIQLGFADTTNDEIFLYAWTTRSFLFFAIGP